MTSNQFRTEITHLFDELKEWSWDNPLTKQTYLCPGAQGRIGDRYKKLTKVESWKIWVVLITKDNEVETIQALADPLRLILEIKMRGHKQMHREELTRRFKRTSTAWTQTPGRDLEPIEQEEEKTYHGSHGSNDNKSEENGQETRQQDDKENDTTHNDEEKK